MKTETEQKIEELRQLVEKKQDWLFRFAYMRIGERETAEDLVQDVFLRLFWQEGRISSIKNIEQYLLRSISNACQDHLRQKLRKMVPLEHADHIPVQETDLHLQEEFQRINRMLDGLPEEQAETVRLHCIDELTFRQIAELQNLPIATVKSRYRYAILHIQQQLKSSKDEL